MSTARGSATARAVDGIKAAYEDYDIPTHAEIAELVVEHVYPEITNAKQMLGVPKGSILITARPDVLVVYSWDGFDLHLLKVGGPGGSFNPSYIIKDWGPLTVVWMP
jgi:hypothetical protein